MTTSKTNSNERELNAVLLLTKAITDAIRDAGEIPSGHLYAAVMGTVNLDSYNRIIALLTRAKLIEVRSNHLVVWVGPRVPLEVPKQKYAVKLETPNLEWVREERFDTVQQAQEFGRDLADSSTVDGKSVFKWWVIPAPREGEKE